MNSKSIKILLSVFLIAMLLIGSAFSEDDGNRKTNTLNKPTGTPVRAYMNINSISTVIKNTGISDIDVAQANSGLVFPKGSGKTAVFQSGLVWGAILNDPLEFDPHVGGSTYEEGLQGGWIDANGNVIPPSDPRARIFRVRPDVYPGGPTIDLSSEATDEGRPEADVRAQYETDWTEWPADLGAPYFDGNANGQYDSDPTSGDIPGVVGANQTIWYVANDQEPGLTQNLYGTQPMGMEMQATFWGYAQTGALGNMFFRRYVLINKTDVLGNPRTFDSMYVSMWSDVDLGNSTDDFAGSDTTLSLMYCYNGQANDATYNPLPPPAVGFDFFQGPLVDGVAGEDKNKNGIDDAADFGIFKGKVVGPGKLNLPMTAAYYFTRGDATVTDPVLGSPSEGAVRFYRFMQGKVGLTGDPFINPVTGLPTPFVLSGDPTTGEGWVDGQLQAPGDRRIGEASGPFTMAPGDTQEVVVAEICAGAIPGVDRISAVSLLKFYDQIAQVAYDNFFDLPVPPPSPAVSVVALDEKIVLDWGENPQRVEATESSNSKGYLFEGYNVYQLPNSSASVSEGKRIATYDVVNGIGKINDLVFDPTTGSVVVFPVQFGNDTGIRRYIEITQDALNQLPLVNGNRYYFAVTAYNYNPDPQAVPNNLENPLAILTIVPQSKNPGEVFGGETGDTLTISKNIVNSALPPSDGYLYPIVIDPRNPNFKEGNQYKVGFEETEDGTFWYVERNGEKILENQTNQNADIESPIVDGIQFRVQGAPQDFKGFDMTANGLTPDITGAECTYEITQIGADLKGVSADWYRDVLLSIHGGALSGCYDPMQAGGGYFFCVAGGPTIGDHQAALGRWTRDGSRWEQIIPNNYEIRWTGDAGNPAGKAWMAYSTGSLVDVPFSLWFLGPNLDDPSDDIRMMPWLFDDDEDDVFSFKLDHTASGGNNDPYSDWIYFMMPNDNPQPGEQDYLDLVAAMTPDPTNWAGDVEVEHIARIVIMNWNQNQGSGGENEWPDVGTVFRIRGTIPNSPNDYYTFTVPKYEINNDLARDQVDQINVYPNPYYGVNTEELNKYNRFVTFTHLPKNAKVRIFNLAGVLVKNIEKTDDGQFLRWDLANQDGLPVASGLYIAYIDLPDLGTTKILKLAIVQEQQILDRF
ncbi:MAG: T9SS type A sorting domain-containing protein [Ignavibacteriaceae bacterium]|nr:T9SS type A sorting domain-containing protein [Ignavibacteriaceae bacterium]